MGYIFDALTRSSGDPLDSRSASNAPQPAEPTTDGDSDAGDTGTFKFTGAPQPHEAITDDVPPPPPAATPAPMPAVEARKSRPRPAGEPAPFIPAAGAVDERLVALTSPSGVLAEEYRAIRTGLLARWEHRRHLVTTITSATPQEGKTITSLNLGMIFAELRNRKTLVIEADLRLPQFNKLLGLPASHGLVGVLQGDAQLEDAVQVVGAHGLNVLTAGRHGSVQAVQLLSSPTMATLLKAARRQYDHIIIDTPPVVELSDAGIIGALSDDVILIARMDRTPKSLIEQAVRTLTSYGAPVCGVVATDQPQHHRNYYYHRYGYRYRYRYYHKAAA